MRSTQLAHACWAAPRYSYATATVSRRRALPALLAQHGQHSSVVRGASLRLADQYGIVMEGPAYCGASCVAPRESWWLCWVVSALATVFRYSNVMCDISLQK